MEGEKEERLEQIALSGLMLPSFIFPSSQSLVFVLMSLCLHVKIL